MSDLRREVAHVDSGVVRRALGGHGLKVDPLRGGLYGASGDGRLSIGPVNTDSLGAEPDTVHLADRLLSILLDPEGDEAVAARLRKVSRCRKGNGAWTLPFSLSNMTRASDMEPKALKASLRAASVTSTERSPMKQWKWLPVSSREPLAIAQFTLMALPYTSTPVK